MTNLQNVPGVQDNIHLDACFSIEGGCALHFIDEQPVRSVVFEESKNAYLVTMDDDGLNEEAYSRKEIF